MCNTILESKYRHNFVTCGCSNETFTDGGLVYQRLGGKDLDKIKSIAEYETITYKEAKQREQKRQLEAELLLQQRIDNGEMVCISGRWMSKEVAQIVLGVLYNKEK